MTTTDNVLAREDQIEQLARRVQAIAERWKGVNGGIYTIRAMALDMAHTLMEENTIAALRASTVGEGETLREILAACERHSLDVGFVHGEPSRKELQERLDTIKAIATAALTTPPAHGSREEVIEECARVAEAAHADDDGIDRQIRSEIAKQIRSLSSSTGSAPSGEGWRPTHRHKKRGTTYQVLGVASVQMATEQQLYDFAPVVVYRGEDGMLWVRHEREFNDGRFEPLHAAAPAKE